ncbi:succinate dehydrogenase, cytochrome b556 subunit [Methylocystis sp. IM3]|uniref:succinate dehydrogenase, cytochrome b556 subunit n=1 Tax=unclassified Methylocystis TaxID=2625913 RepID=UPI0030F7D689
MVERLEARPRSPHLQVYRPTLTMTMSIAHRMTGVTLYFGTILFVWWLMAISVGPAHYARAQDFMNSIVGQAFLFFFTWSLLHHALGGVRHLIWDLGFAHDYPWREYLAQATIVGSLLGTVFLWVARF